MKRIVVFALFLLVCLAVPSARAQMNPFLGTWKLNLEKSMFPAGMGPKSQMRMVTMDGAAVKYSFEGVDAEGKPTSFSFSSMYDGKDMPVTGTGMPYGADTVAIKRISPNKSQATLKKAGKVVATSTAIVTKDGKTTILESKGTGPDGKPWISKSIYDKQ